MRVSLKWLKDYVDINITAEELAEKLTLSGVAVENIDYLGKGLTKVVVGKIDKIEKHPDADKLRICTVNVGSESVQIVTGAANVQEGHVVPAALVGADLPTGLKIKKSKLRGVESSGMLCSALELGLDPKVLPEDQQNGIMLLDENSPLGQDISQVLGLDDIILELELTPNRGDCLSMLGVARDVAAILGTPMRYPQIVFPELAEKIEGQIKINIEDPTLSRRYIGRIVKNVKIESSPSWMQQRLLAAGVRPISNIVDITNYVMLEYGQPLHAFDYDTIKDKTIIVRRAKAGESLMTLDDVKRDLNPEMLVIADSQGPVAVAGVMGGLVTEVTDKTTTILLESAHFHGTSIRRTSKAMGLRSEASMRFEKGIDANGSLTAVNRAVQLIQELGAGVVVAGYEDNYPSPMKNVVINFRGSQIKRLLGIEIPLTKVAEILNSLQFKVKPQYQDVLKVTVPTNRPDITLEADLVEEVARLYGYNNIPVTLPSGPTTQGQKTREQKLSDAVKDTLTAYGMTELINLSFANPRDLDKINRPEDDLYRKAVVIQNPLSEEQCQLRTTLIPGLLDTILRNQSRRTRDLAIFELGTVFHPGTEVLPTEEQFLAGAVVGNMPTNWKQKGQEMDFYFLKGIIEGLLSSLGLTGIYQEERENPTFHPGRTAKILIQSGKEQLEVGLIGEIHPTVTDNYKLTGRVSLFQVNVGQLIKIANTRKSYSSLPKFPGTDRDLALVVKAEVEAQKLLSVIENKGGKLLKQVNIFDLYQGSQIKEGYKSMAFSLAFQAPDRTLTDEEINQVMEKIKKALANEGAELRL